VLHIEVWAHRQFDETEKDIILSVCINHHTQNSIMKLHTGLSGRGSFNNRSPRTSLQYLASLYCCPLQQWFSNESMTGKSDVTKAVSRRA